MPEISVSADRWLGFGRRYSVRIDGHEVGRLGRGAKRVVSNVGVGKHSVLVDFAGRTTASEQVELAEGDSASFGLAFGSAVAAVALEAVKPVRRRVTEPIGAAGESSFMALVRVD